MVMTVSMITVSISCNSNGDEDNTFGDTSGANMPGIENVNGNMPDTTNSIMIDDTAGRTPVDTLRQ